MFPLMGRSFIMDNDETIAITRQSRVIGTGINWVAGMPVPDPSQTITQQMTCNVQPLDQGQLDLLPDGQQISDQLYLYCQDQATLPLIGDVFEREGQTFQIQDTEEWGSYTRARAVNSEMLQTLEGYDT